MSSAVLHEIDEITEGKKKFSFHQAQPIFQHKYFMDYKKVTVKCSRSDSCKWSSMKNFCFAVLKMSLAFLFSLY